MSNADGPMHLSPRAVIDGDGLMWVEILDLPMPVRDGRVLEFDGRMYVDRQGVWVEYDALLRAFRGSELDEYIVDQLVTSRLDTEFGEPS